MKWVELLIQMEYEDGINLYSKADDERIMSVYQAGCELVEICGDMIVFDFADFKMSMLP
jgi:hypothetical protein